MSETVVRLDDHGVTIDDVVAVARGNARVELTENALAGIAVARARVDELAASPEPKYGISTGFGALANRHISPELRAQLQRSLIRSHAAGMGDPVEREVVRALMFLRLKTLASGRTGIRPVVAETMAALLNAGITPKVHEYGSLGCSGDLAPLSHCALVLMGEGRAYGADGARPTRPTCSPPPASSRSCSRPRRASRSSTAPTACSACSAWPSSTSSSSATSPTSRRR